MSIDLVFIGSLASLFSMQNLIKSYDLSPRCSKFTGRYLIETIKKTRREDKVWNSSVVIYDAKSVYVDDGNWMAYVFKNVMVQNEFMTTCVDYQRRLMKNNDNDMVAKYLRNGRFQKECPKSCSQKTLIIVDTVDFWNWWWVLVTVSSHYTLLLSILEDINAENIEILHLAEDSREKKGIKMPLRDIYHVLFSTKGNKRLDKTTKFANVCYSNVVLLPTRENPSILKNIHHKYDNCVSSVMISFHIFFRRQMNLQSVKSNKICWVYRKHKIAITSWQKLRHIPQQDILISEVGMKTLNFGKHNSLRDQLDSVNECKLLVGAHGAGLNLAIGMEKPALLELTPGVISNRNAQNLMTALNGCVNVVPIKFSKINTALIRNYIKDTKDKCF